jgi:predicted DNA-binding protein
MKPMICRLPEELYERLRKRAFEEKVSMAEIIRRALEEKVPSETERTIETLRNSFGGWKGLIDAKELKRNIYEDRLVSTRLEPKL